MTHRHVRTLMVRGAAHCASPIGTGGQSSSNSSAEAAFAITNVIDTLEKREGGGVGRCGSAKVPTQGLNSNVSVTNDFAVLKSLRSSVVGGVRIGERASL